MGICGVSCFGLWSRKAGLLIALAGAVFVATGGCANRFSTLRTPAGAKHGTVIFRDRNAEVVIHVVKAGETLWKIADDYSVSVESLGKRNGISNPKALAIGAKLQIVKPGGQRAREIEGNLGPWPMITREAARRTRHDRQHHHPGSGSKAAGGQRSLQWPVDGVVTGRFGRRWGRQHKGIDIGAPAGTTIYAAERGRVVFSDRHGGYGNLVVIEHDDDIVTGYAHNSRNLGREGASVRRGQPVAAVGDTGRATGPHLHFEVRRGDDAVNPMPFLPRPTP